jgi:hypothetical protein
VGTSPAFGRFAYGGFVSGTSVGFFGTGFNAKAFGYGASRTGSISAIRLFANTGGTAGSFGNFLNTTAYAGFRFELDDTSTLVFGWAKLRVDITSSPTLVVLNIYEWAYDDSGAAIRAGEVPVPGTALLTLLGLGAMGVQAFRRRREEGLKRLADERDAAAA